MSTRRSWLQIGRNSTVCNSDNFIMYQTDGDTADEDFHPTARAIVEQFNVLKKKKSGVKGGTVKKSFSTPKSTTMAATSKTRTTAFKTLDGSTKRSRPTISDHDDDEESKMDFDTPLPKRATPSRRPVTPKTYADTESSEDEAMEGANGADDSDDGLEAAFDAVKASGKITETMPSSTNGAGNHSPTKGRDSVVGTNGAKAAATRNYLAEDSDGSDLPPGI